MATARKRKIEPNLRITGLCGELLEKGEGDKRKKRRRLHGVVVSACGRNTWNVQWDGISTTEEIKLCRSTVDDGFHEEDTPPIRQGHPEPSIAHTSASSSMDVSAVISPDENEIDLDFILHSNSSEDQSSTSINSQIDFTLTTDNMEGMAEAGTPLSNGIFVDDGDGIGDDEILTELETRQHLSYSERLDEQKRQVQQLIGKEVRIEYGRKKRVRDFVEWTVVDDQDISEDSKFQKDHEMIGI